eukprot:CAMPEP_0197177618 /NCGR_PEP_ID=MMETSP1423-20130617/3159_1 /TAXON_ID=476441 /ORGANISM="Pseudo-nitzschia heimii, Strain UNC1101" /LENGTH=398 /DNA_ID=CAMNT_0042627193 /DNA_START=93 /DNA_END=1289 /DNA_ORIENTATION=+
MFLSKHLALTVTTVLLFGSSVVTAASEAKTTTRHLRRVPGRRLPSSSKSKDPGDAKGEEVKKGGFSSAAAASSKTKSKSKVPGEAKLPNAAAATSKTKSKEKAPGGVKKGEVKAQLTSTTTATPPLKTRKGEKFMKTDKAKNKNKKSTSVDPNLLNLIVSAPTPPPKLRPSMEDWIEACPTESRAIENCVVIQTTASKPENCRMCLKGLASFNNPPPPSDNGVKLCAEGPTCGECTTEQVRPFYACGLRVDGAFVENNNVGGRLDPGDSNSTATNATTVVVTTPVEASVDEHNCPALWPGTNTVCVMLSGYTAKKCVYPEYGMDSVCECSAPGLTWTCANGPVSLQIGGSIGNVVDGSAATIPASVGTAAGAAATGSSTAMDMPKPIATIDAVINTLP